MTRANIRQTKKALGGCARAVLALALSALLCAQVIPAQALGTEDGPESAPSVTPRAGEISVTVTPGSTAVQTYTDPRTGTAPSELLLALDVSANQAGLQGATIEVPYGCVPDGTGVWQNFKLGDALYTFIDPGAPAQASLVESYEEQPGKLIIHLKTTTQKTETINLRFQFNNDYSGKIPEGQVVWSSPRAIVKDSQGGTISEHTAADIKTSAVDGMSLYVTKFFPSDDQLTGDTISLRITWLNYNRQFSFLDGSADNKLYIEVPTGSVLEGAAATFFDSTEVTSAQDPSIPAGQSRYYRALTDDSATFNSWETLGNPNTCSRAVDVSVVIPSGIANGTSVNVTGGMIYTKLNGTKQEKTAVAPYTKAELPDWSFSKAVTHGNTAGAALTWVVQGKGEKTANTTMHIGGYATMGYISADTTKNTGKNAIKGVEIRLKQPDGSAKVNFSGVTIYAFTQDDSVPRGRYKVEFKVRNALTGAEETKPGATTTAQETPITPPALGANEYIDEVIVTPMGATGADEGELPSLNGFAIVYRAKSWADDRWPDGSAVPLDASTPVSMTWQMDYLDESTASNPVPSTHQGDSGTVYYAPAYAVDATVSLVSSNAANREPGDTVNYELQGVNNGTSVIGDLAAIGAGQWANPEIGIAVPKVLELQDPDAPKDFVDKVNDVTHAGAVSVRLVSSDDANNYYRLTSNGVVAHNNGIGVSFAIPLEFRIADGTMNGTYAVPFATVSSTPSADAPYFVQLSRPTNNLGDDQASALGYANAGGQGSCYSGVTTGLAGLSVAIATKVHGGALTRDPATGEWVEADAFAVDNGDSPQAKASIVNVGNTVFGDVKLYSVLPFDGSKHTIDGVEYASTGGLYFAGLESAVTGEKVYYTTRPASELPDYTTNLQDWDEQTLAGYGFSTDVPDDPAAITAAFIDFGTATIRPGESFDNIPTFLVPDQGDQVAYVEFQYSARQQGGTAQVLNGTGGPVAFVTAHATLDFDENLPEVLLPGVEHASGMPQAVRHLLSLEGEAEAVVPQGPTLAGYSFVHWQDAAGKAYRPGDVVTLSADALQRQGGQEEHAVVLQAVWAPKQVEVSFDANHGGAGAPEKVAYAFGDALDTTRATVPQRAGYRFLGWASAPDAAAPNVAEGAPVDFEEPMTLYAVWEQLPAQEPGSDGSTTAGPSNPSAPDADGTRVGVLLPRTGDAPAGAACALAGLGALAALAAAVARRRARQA